MDFYAGQYLMGTPALGDVDGDGLNEIIVSGYSSILQYEYYSNL